MADTARAARAAPLRRDAVLETVAFAAERLLMAADWHDVASEVLARLGVAAEVSRACITENATDPQGRLCSTLVCEWCAPGVPTSFGTPSLEDGLWEDGFGRWVETMQAGEPIVGAVNGFPAEEQPDLRGQQIVSLAYHPVIVDGVWWGTIGFDDCEVDRDWSLSELDGLRTVATLLGASIARQRQEERVRAAEYRYRSVVERIPAVTYLDVVEPDGVRIGFMSPQIEGLLGYPADLFLGDPDFWFDIVHPEDNDRIDEAARAAGRDNVAFDEEYRMHHADGRWIWIHDVSTPVRDDAGEVTHYQGFMTDVTSRKEAEQRLRAAERRYRGVVENIPAVAYIDEPTGLEGHEAARISFISPQIETVLGYPSERFLDDPSFWFSIMHPDDLARLREVDAFSVNDLETFDQEYRMRHADGHWVWVHDTSTTIYRDDGEADFFQGFMLDVTARHEADEQLRLAEERFRVLVEQMPAAVYTEELVPGTVRAARMDYLSPRAETLFGYPVVSWLTEPGFWDQIVHPEDRERVLAATEHVNTTGQPMSLDYRYLAADGRVVWVHEEAVLVRDPGGEPVHWQGFILDITERKAAEDRIRTAEERFRLLVEQTPAVTYQEAPDLDQDHPDDTLLYVSPQIERILGYPTGQWYSRDFWRSILHPEDAGGVLAESARTGASGEPFRQDYRMFAADGRTVWIHDESHLIVDADGRPLHWQGVMLDITDRKEAEDQLHVTQGRLQALIEHIPAVVYMETLDADPNRFYLSPQVEQMFGYTAEEWTWTDDFWIDHVHPDDRERVDDADVRTNETRDVYATEYRFRRADGAYLWVHDEAVYVPTPDGGGFWQGFLFDITERKEAEEQLASAERVLRATVEHLPAVIYREAQDEDPGRSYLSPQLLQVFGYEPDEWRWTPDFWRDHVHPEDVEWALAMNAHANASREPFSADYRFARADGSFVWVHDEAVFVPGTNEDDGWWQGFLIDITERKQAERQLQEAEEKFRTIVEQNPAVIYTQEFDASNPSISRTTYISPRQPEVFGYTVEEILNDPTLWARIVHPEDRDRVLSEDLRSNEEVADTFSLEYRMIAKDGRIVWVQDDAKLVRIDDRPPFWQGFLLDITERKRAEEQLERALEVEREATRRLRALDDMKNTFLQAVSHDLRTPLAAILGLAITLERGDVHLEEDDAKDLARRIAGNARRLDRLVTNLLDLDRLARGIVAPKIEPIDVGALVRRVVAESELVPASRLVTDLQPVVVPVDAAKVERIIENLLANTARHTPSDATIWVSVRPEDGGCLLAVEDDGPGVDEDLREVIFEPFQQGPDAPQHAPGVGVGLTLVRRFAELHGGRAWVTERDGGGASFRVWFPAEPVMPLGAAGN
ncbi:MAG: PAS domain-containing protein [Actinomycetota bacterium]